MKYGIVTTYAGSFEHIVDIPGTWDDVEWWYVKWDTLFYKMKGGDKEFEVALYSDDMNAIDWKRPVETQVFKTYEDAEEEIDWNEEIT